MNKKNTQDKILALTLSCSFDRHGHFAKLLTAARKQTCCRVGLQPLEGTLNEISHLLGAKAKLKCHVFCVIVRITGIFVICIYFFLFLQFNLCRATVKCRCVCEWVKKVLQSALWHHEGAEKCGCIQVHSIYLS